MVRKKVYRRYVVPVSSRGTFVNLIELGIVDFDIILEWIIYTRAICLKVVEPISLSLGSMLSRL